MPQVYFVQKLSVALYLLLLLRKTAQENCAVLLSRPIRGAWIEILRYYFEHGVFRVAPHTGRVD